MPPTSQPEWWRRRRLIWPLAALLALGVSLGVALVRSGDSRIVVYNETGTRIAELTVAACGQSQTFQNVGDRESVRLRLENRGGESEITIATNAVTMWHGDYIEPRGGYRTFVRLRRDGQIESTATLSWWQGRQN